MALGRMSLSVADARDLAEGALRGVGYHDDEARIIADHVIDAALCGYEYSGLAKILNIPESEHFKLQRRPMKVLRETDVSLAFDGGNNLGMLALFHAAQATIKKAASHGIALVSVSDAWMSGRSAYYRDDCQCRPRRDPHCGQLAAGGSAWWRRGGARYQSDCYCDSVVTRAHCARHWHLCLHDD
jgi:LDH2 family malate/lactate/ureidoglycolate dehydrogenase